MRYLKTRARPGPRGFPLPLPSRSRSKCGSKHGIYRSPRAVTARIRRPGVRQAHWCVTRVAGTPVAAYTGSPLGLTKHVSTLDTWIFLNFSPSVWSKLKSRPAHLNRAKPLACSTPVPWTVWGYVMRDLKARARPGPAGFPLPLPSRSRGSKHGIYRSPRAVTARIQRSGVRQAHWCVTRVAGTPAAYTLSGQWSIFGILAQTYFVGTNLFIRVASTQIDSDTGL
jgi:hypothetical protein